MNWNRHAGCWIKRVGCSLSALAWLQLPVIESHAGLPPVVSQVVSVSAPILDEYHQPLPGTDPSSELFGIAPVEGTLVQIYQTADGVAYPPDVLGNPDPRTLLVKETRIGIGASPLESAPAKFGCILSPRPDGGTRLFVRVFNASSLGSASFYKDSQVFTVSATENDVFLAEFDTDMIPLDLSDEDGDGLIRSWEISYGSDPTVVDTDADGFTDGEERVAGTDPVEESSYFIIADLLPSPPDQIALSWLSESNRTYTIECQPLLDGESSYTVVDAVSGTGDVLQHLVPAFTNGHGIYRVRVSITEESE